MAARGNEVADAIESQVREAIEKMVGDIRSSIDDVRQVVVQQLDAAMQSVQADAKSLSLRSSIERTISEAGEIEAPQPAPAVAQPRVDVDRLKRAIQGVEGGKSQVEVLNALLEQAIGFGSRAALLILKGDSFAGWKGLGFNRFGGNDESIKRFTAAPGSVPELDRIVREESVIGWDGASIAARFGAAAPSRAVLVPMVIKDKIAAAVYVDQVDDDEEKFDRASIELLVFTTGLLIDTLAIRKKIPSPSLSPSGAVQSTPAAAPSPTAAPAPRAAAPVAPPPPTFGGTVAVPGLALEGESSGIRRPAAPPAAPPPPTQVVPPKPAAAPAPASGLGDASERPSTQYVPPPGIARGGALGGPQTEESKKQDEARRFARLLVSEIKLYNESKVEQGRKNKDLYERMKEDIDRSRQMYDERISEDIRKSSNFFYDELVRILADGDADALGL